MTAETITAAHVPASRVRNWLFKGINDSKEYIRALQEFQGTEDQVAELLPAVEAMQKEAEDLDLIDDCVVVVEYERLITFIDQLRVVEPYETAVKMFEGELERVAK